MCTKPRERLALSRSCTTWHGAPVGDCRLLPQARVRRAPHRGRVAGHRHPVLAGVHTHAVLVASGTCSHFLPLQSDDCLAALGVDVAGVQAAAAQRGLLWTRVVVRDFDRLDQAAALPNMARALNALIALGRVPYVHCTAGINRAPLSVVGLLTFARGWELDAAVAQLRGNRQQANPYTEPWKAARARLLAGREEEVYARVAAAGGPSTADGGDWIGRDWSAAQRQLIMDTFERAAACDVALARGLVAAGGANPAAAAFADVLV